MTKARRVRDSMGEVAVPSGVLYGAQTQRAVENFQISPLRLPVEFVSALGLIKACTATVNGELGAVPAETAKRIVDAANQVAGGMHFDQFVVDVFQTGSGTSTHMNANEVIGALAQAHPNDEVNRSQSSNDVFPSALHISAARQVRDVLLPGMDELRAELERKAGEFWDVRKIGRTHLQDATPMRLGQEFSGYAHQVRASMERVSQALDGIHELPLGGTAVGTGVNAPPGFAARTVALLAERTKLPLREARNHFEAQAAKDAVLFLSGALKTYGVALGKIANDIRWLGSGPRAGLGELRLPELQPGSSIMPGKVNPVIPESVLMVTAQVVGHDAAISWACAGGNFELNTMMPLLAYNLLDSIAILGAASRSLAGRCVKGLTADRTRTEALIEGSLALATALTPLIGYEQAAAIAKEAHETNRTVREVAKEKSDIAPGEIDRLLEAETEGL